VVEMLLKVVLNRE